VCAGTPGHKAIYKKRTGTLGEILRFDLFIRKRILYVKIRPKYWKMGDKSYLGITIYFADLKLAVIWG
jgi:hypothetical protein